LGYGSENLFNKMRIQARLARYRSFKSYSQFGEDAQIRRLVSGKSKFYLDIGSGHPVVGNNTFFLYKEGWNGVLVEPIPEMANLSKLLRKRDICLNSAVSETEKDITFYHFHPYQYSTLNEQHAKAALDKGIRLVSSKIIKTLSAKSLVNLLPAMPSVLSIDVEGNDFEIMMSLFNAGITPEVISIEDFKREDTSEIHKGMIKFGYEISARIYPSSIYSKRTS